jgi:sigma-B regulation protein RsbU (phosphoserine phosphatase)
VLNQIGPYLKEREEMKTSLEAARLIQQRLLPEADFRKNGFRVAGVCAYSDETGGDFYDFLPVQQGEDEQVVVLLGDVSGHGIAAALLMAMARALMRSNLRQFNGDLSRALAATNSQLVSDTEPQKFVTLFALKWQPATAELFWATAGHDPALCWQHESGQIVELESEGIPLGFLREAVFSESGPKPLKPGDVVVIGTDGIWEAENEEGEMFGKERLKVLLRQYHTATANELAEKIVQEVKNYCGNRKLQDDVTVVVVKMESPEVA